MTFPTSRIGRVGKHQMTFIVRSNLRNALYKAIDYVDDVWGRFPGQCVTVYDLHERAQFNIYEDPMITTHSRASNKGHTIPLTHIQSKNQSF